MCPESPSKAPVSQQGPLLARACTPWSFVILNWAAPNLYTAPLQRTQSAIMGGLCANKVGTCVGICLMPTFSFHKGQLHTLEQACCKLLVGANLNVVHVVVLPYMGRSDDREKRSLAEPSETASWPLQEVLLHLLLRLENHWRRVSAPSKSLPFLIALPCIDGTCHDWLNPMLSQVVSKRR